MKLPEWTPFVAIIVIWFALGIIVGVTAANGYWR